MYVTIYGRYISINDYGLVYANISLEKVPTVLVLKYYKANFEWELFALSTMDHHLRAYYFNCFHHLEIFY